MRQYFISGSTKSTILILFIFSGILMSLFPTAVYAEGIAISGSFNNYHYKTVPGETVSTPDIDIIVHNNYNVALKMQFAVESPADVFVDLEGKQVTIPANSSSAFPVSVSVGKSVVPGDYEIGISAEPVPDAKSGIAVLGGAQLRTKLSVFGEAGKVMINVVDPEGEAFVEGEIKLFKKEGNNFTSVGYARGYTLTERVAVGEYIAKVYYRGDEVGQSSFFVDKDETKEITIQAKTVLIQGFSVTPQYAGNSKEISSARVTYTLKNLYKPVSEVRVVLKVYHNSSAGSDSLLSKLNFLVKKVHAASGDNLLEEVEMASYPSLEVGSQNGRYVYAPIDKWKKGEYKFSLTVFGTSSSSGESVIYGESQNVSVKVGGKNTVYFIVILIVIIIIGLVVLFILRKKKWLRVPKK